MKYNKTIKLTRKGALEFMTDIIKLEDLTLNDIKSRIINLDNRFAQGTLTFTNHRQTYRSFMTDYEKIGFNLFTNMLMQVTGDDDVFPLYYFLIHGKNDSISKPARDVLQVIEDHCEELLSERMPKELKDDLLRFQKEVQTIRLYSQLSPKSAHSGDQRSNTKYYIYKINHERRENIVLLHVHITEAPQSEGAGFVDRYKYTSKPENYVNGEYDYLVKRLTKYEFSRRAIAEFEEITPLLEQFFVKFQEYGQALVERAHAYKAVPDIKDEYLLTVEVDAQEYDKLAGLSELGKVAKMNPTSLLDVTNSLSDSRYSLIQSLRNNINVYKEINKHALFDGRGSAKKLENGEMSINQAKSYANSHGMLESYQHQKSYQDYISDALENINELLEGIENYDMGVYLELTRFKVNAARMIKEAFSKTYEITLKELQYSWGYEYGLEKHINALAHGRETQDEVNALISKLESDIDEIESLMKRIQSDFNECLVQCSKMIEGDD